jgi:hypothetical protein
VADRDDPRIRVFSSSGRSVRSFGRRGEGPGEFTGIERVFPVSGGSIAVVDMRLFRLIRVDTTGRHLSSISLKNFPFDAAAAPGSGSVLLLFSRFHPGTSFIQSAGPSVDTLVGVIGPMRDFPRVETPGEVHSLAVAPDGSVAVGDGTSEYRIRIFRNGRWRDLTRTIPRKPRTPVEMAEMQSRVLADGRKARAEGGQPSGDIAREKPHFEWMGFRYDSGGRLWVKTGRGDETRTIFDVFAASAAYLGEVTVPGRVSSFSVSGTWLATAGENSDGVPQVTLWTVSDR